MHVIEAFILEVFGAVTLKRSSAVDPDGTRETGRGAAGRPEPVSWE
jgi:hypothetical protein